MEAAEIAFNFRHTITRQKIAFKHNDKILKEEQVLQGLQQYYTKKSDLYFAKKLHLICNFMNQSIT